MYFKKERIVLKFMSILSFPEEENRLLQITGTPGSRGEEEQTSEDEEEEEEVLREAGEAERVSQQKTQKWGNRRKSSIVLQFL